MQNHGRIGIFDSGIGGLTVLAECLKLLPDCTYYYYGDNFRAPYGSRPPEEIAAFAEEGMEILQRRNIDAAVLACNTATAVAAERLRSRFPFPILGMEPALKPAAEKYRDVLVLATPATAASERLSRLAARFPDRRFKIVGLPDLAGAIEANLTRGALLSIFDHLPPYRPECVVLGCTHYVFFRREIADFYGCEVFDGGAGTAKRLRSLIGIGKGDHQNPQNTNKCFTQKCDKSAVSSVIFLGKARKMNESVFNSNICLQFW